MSNRRGTPLAGKVALVTGSARRVGRAAALALAEEGAHVITHARSSVAEIESVADEIRAAGGQATALLADITDEAAVERLVEEIHERVGRVDILVNNAAIRSERALADLDLATFRSVYTVAVEGAFLVTRALVPDMVDRGGGRIVTIGGVSAHAGAIDRLHVATAKSALIGFAKALAAELGDHGITSNLVVPGRIGGKRSATSGAGGRFAGDRGPIVNREGEPNDVAEVIRMLASPAGGYITGQTIHVSGGLYLP